MLEEIKCGRCFGTGYIPSETCDDCIDCQDICPKCNGSRMEIPKKVEEIEIITQLKEPVYKLNLRDIVELVYFFQQNGYISRELHDHVHGLNFNFSVVMDEHYPNWTPADLERIVKEVRGE